MSRKIEILIYASLALLFSLMLAPHSARAAETVRPETDASFVRMNAMNVSILQDLQVRGMLQIELGLDIADDKLREKTISLAPRLQDAYLIALRHYTTHQLQLYRVPNVDQIAGMLQQVTSQVLGQEGAVVLLSQVMLHKPY